MSDLRRTYPTVDYLKFFCAVLIVGVHTEPFVFNYWLDKGFGIVTRLAVPYFFIASGYFLFIKMNFNQPRHFDIRPFLKRILLIYGIWSLVYLPLRIHAWITAGRSLNGFIIKYIKDIFIYGTYMHLWFLPALTIGAVIVFVLLRFMKIKYVIAISIAVLCMGTMLSTYSTAVIKIFNLGQSPLTDYFPSVIELLNGFNYGFPYVSFGAFLAYQNKKIFNKDDIQKWVLWFALSMFGLCAESLAAVYLLKADSTLLWFSQVPAVLTLFVISLKSKMFNVSPLSKLLRNVSILIYTAHVLFMELFEVIFVQISNSSIYHPLLFVCTLTATAILAFLVDAKLTVRWKPIKLLY